MRQSDRRHSARLTLHALRGCVFRLQACFAGLLSTDGCSVQRKLALCEVVKGLKEYEYRNSTDCKRPPDVAKLVAPVRLTGWEDSDTLDLVFETGR